jgi:hypothetical protein
MSERDLKRIEVLSELLAGFHVQHKASYGDIQRRSGAACMRETARPTREPTSQRNAGRPNCDGL